MVDKTQWLSILQGIDFFFFSIKMMENAFDTLKTAFPNPDLFSPVEDFETDGRTVDSRKYRWELYIIFCVLLKGLSISNGIFLVLCTLNRRSIFPSKISPSLNIPDLHPKVAYCFSEGSTVSKKNRSDKWKMNVRPSWHGTFGRDAFRFLAAWQCQTLSALSNSRKDDYVSRLEKKQRVKAAISHPKRRRKQEKHKWQVNIFVWPRIFLFPNVSVNSVCSGKYHH